MVLITVTQTTSHNLLPHVRSPVTDKPHEENAIEELRLQDMMAPTVHTKTLLKYC